MQPHKSNCSNTTNTSPKNHFFKSITELIPISQNHQRFDPGGYKMLNYTEKKINKKIENPKRRARRIFHTQNQVETNHAQWDVTLKTRGKWRVYLVFFFLQGFIWLERAMCELCVSLRVWDTVGFWGREGFICRRATHSTQSLGVFGPIFGFI